MADGITYALIVGINKYESSDITPLRYAASDAIAFRNVLIEKGLVSDRNAFLMTTETELLPTGPNILFRIGKLMDVVKPDDTVIFYYAGHGQALQGESLLYTYNSDPRDIDALRLTSISLGLLGAKFARMNAAQILFFLDACRNSPELGRSNDDCAFTADFARDVSALVQRNSDRTASGMAQSSGLLFSCQPGQRSFEPEALQAGLFTHFLTQVIREAGSDTLTLIDLHGEVARRMKEYSDVHLPAGREQVPWIQFSGAAVPALQVCDVGSSSESSATPVEAGESYQVSSGEVVSHSILPLRKGDLQRAVVIYDKTRLEGKVYGASVQIGQRAQVTGHIVAREAVWVGTDAIVEGSLVAGAQIGFAGRVRGDIWAPNVVLKEAVRVQGRVVSLTALSLPEGSIVDGVVCASDLTIGARCEIKACIGQNIVVGEGASVGVVQAGGAFTGARNIEFAEIFARSGVSVESGAKGKAVVADSDVNLGDGGEVNFICAEGRILLGARCKARFVSGKSVEVGEASRVECVYATQEILIRERANIGALFCLRQITLSAGVSVDAWSVLSLQGDISVSDGVLLHGVSPSPANVFGLSEEREILIEKPQGAGSLVTVLMDHELYKTIREVAKCQLWAK